MTIVEALKRSKETGQSFTRGGSTGYEGWISYHEGWVFKDLTTEDLMADDWEESSAVIERITKGRWTAG